MSDHQLPPSLIAFRDELRHLPTPRPHRSLRIAIGAVALVGATLAVIAATHLATHTTTPTPATRNATVPLLERIAATTDTVPNHDVTRVEVNTVEFTNGRPSIPAHQVRWFAFQGRALQIRRATSFASCRYEESAQIHIASGRPIRIDDFDPASGLRRGQTTAGTTDGVVTATTHVNDAVLSLAYPLAMLRRDLASGAYVDRGITVRQSRRVHTFTSTHGPMTLTFDEVTGDIVESRTSIPTDTRPRLRVITFGPTVHLPATATNLALTDVRTAHPDASIARPGQFRSCYGA